MRFFTPATVDGVLDSIRKNIADLNSVEAHNREGATLKQDIAARMVTEANMHSAEADRAARVASKLTQLID